MKVPVRLLFVALAVTCVAGQDCGAILTEPSGTLSTPRFPSQYPDNSNCTWNLSTDADTFIELTFTAFVLHSSDYVEVYDGPTSDWPLLLRHTDFYIPAAVRSTSSELMVNFVSDDAVAYSGFVAEYISISKSTGPPPPTLPPGEPNCGGTLYGDGRIVSPNYPSNYFDGSYCVWYLQSGSESSITLQIDTFLTDPNDSLSIFENWEPMNGPLSEFNGQLTEKVQVNSSRTNQFLVVFYTDESVNESGFLADFY